MGVAFHEEEPVDEWEDFCNVHGTYYLHSVGCAGCACDEADRQHSTKKEAV